MNSVNRNSSVPSANSNLAANTAPANLPAGISTVPLSNAVNTMSANAVSPKPRTTPGIPSPAELKKQAKPGTTPTPGIPSADEMRKAFAKPAADANTASQPMMKEVPMMKSIKPANKP